MKIDVNRIIKECKKKELPEVSKDAIDNQFIITSEWLKDKGVYPINDKIAQALCMYMTETKLNIRTKGLFFIGSVGTGKTVAAKVIAGYRKFEFYTAKDLHREYFKYEDKQALYDKIRYNDIIAIDDIGSETTINSYGNKFELMAELMQDRHDLFVRWGTLSILTTNLTGDEFKARYGERVFSRICQMCECITCSGKDLRL